METITPRPAAEVALDNLAAEARTPEDHAQVAEWRAEYAGERSQAEREIGLGKAATDLADVAVPELVAGPGGAAVPRAEVQAAIAAGQEIYDKGNRLA